MAVKLSAAANMGTASLITRTTNDITQVQNVLTMMLRMMIMAPLMCIGGIFMAVSQDAKLSTIFLVVLPVLGGAIALIGAKGLPLFKTIQKKLDRLNLVLGTCCVRNVSNVTPPSSNVPPSGRGTTS